VSEVVFLCNRCGNEDPAFFYNGERGWYCRKCIKFGDAGMIENDIKTVDSEYKLRFNLTDRQKKISSELTQIVREGKSVLLEAVCGAGKLSKLLNVSKILKTPYLRALLHHHRRKHLFLKFRHLYFHFFEKLGMKGCFYGC